MISRELVAVMEFIISECNLNNIHNADDCVDVQFRMKTEITLRQSSQWKQEE